MYEYSTNLDQILVCILVSNQVSSNLLSKTWRNTSWHDSCNASKLVFRRKAISIKSVTLSEQHVEDSSEELPSCNRVPPGWNPSRRQCRERRFHSTVLISRHSPPWWYCLRTSRWIVQFGASSSWNESLYLALSLEVHVEHWVILWVLHWMKFTPQKNHSISSVWYIPHNVTTLGASAFSYSLNLIPLRFSVKIGEMVKQIEYGAFEAVHALIQGLNQ